MELLTGLQSVAQSLFAISSSGSILATKAETSVQYVVRILASISGLPATPSVEAYYVDWPRLDLTMLWKICNDMHMPYVIDRICE